MRAVPQVLLLAGLASGQETLRVSVDSSGAEGDYDSYAPSTSADGQIVAFLSFASNLVAGDTNGVGDVFVRDRKTGLTERISVDSSEAQANGHNDFPSISADGRFVAFESYASNLVAGDTNLARDVFVRDLSTGTTQRVSVDSTGAEGLGGSYAPRISADGNVVAFMSDASNLVAGDTNQRADIFVHDRTTGTTERVSVDSAGAQANDWSFNAAISADGQIVAFASYASNLVTGDTNGVRDVFVHDRSTGSTERVSVDSSGAQAKEACVAPSISADGRIVAFESYSSNLVAGDWNLRNDVFVHDRSNGTTARASVDSAGFEGDGDSRAACVSADGRFVGFNSQATTFVPSDTNFSIDVFVHDRVSGITERVSVDTAGAEANGDSYDLSFSADGQVAAFYSRASNLVTGDTNTVFDVFVRARCDATWTNYGAGFPGTTGVPALTAQTDPVLGTTITVDLENSSGSSTVGALFVGFQRTQLPTNKGGDLLVVPFMTIVLNLPASGLSLDGDLPDDDTLCGITVDVQAIEIDPGAAKRLSFTPGLELVLGH